jgi:hypothetical protein
METTELQDQQQPDAAPNIAVDTPGTADGGEQADPTGRPAQHEDPAKGRQDEDGDAIPVGKLNRRFKELTDELREARARERAKDDLLAEVVRGGVRQQGRPGQQAGEQDPEPRRDDPRFADMDYEEFLATRTRWVARQEFNEQLRAYETRQQQTHQQQQFMRELNRVSSDHIARVEAYQKTNPEFQEVLDSDAPIHPAASLLVQMNEDSPLVLTELHRSPQLLQKLNACRTPFAMSELIGRIAAGAKRGPQVPTTPAPGRTTGGRSSSDPDKPPEDTAEYIKWANKRFGTR